MTFYIDDKDNVELHFQIEGYLDLDTLCYVKSNVESWVILYQNKRDTAAKKLAKALDTIELVNYWRNGKTKLKELQFKGGFYEELYCRNGTFIRKGYNGQIVNEYFCNGQPKCKLILPERRVIWYDEKGNIVEKGKLNENGELHDTLWFIESGKKINFVLYHNGRKL